MESDKRQSRKRANETETVSVVSHQLKAPLAAIKSSLEVVLSGDLGELSKDQKEYVHLAFESVERMIALVKDLLDVSKIDEDLFELKEEAAELAVIVGEVIDDLKVFARAKNTNVVLKVGRALPPLTIDVIRIRQVVYNLIMNAVLYNKGRGNVIVTVDKKGDRVIFSCKDGGIGITKQGAGKIFTKFYRSPQARALVPDGSGLGLFISKAIVEKSGGEIWFERGADTGTIFHFTLPIR